MISKAQKAKIVEDLVEILKDVQGLYLIDFAGLTVENAIVLRRAFKEKNISMRVAKNTLIKRALDEIGGYDIPDENIFGQTALVYGSDDPVIPAKVLKEYLTKGKTEIPRLKAAVLDGQFFDGSQLKQLAAMPTRDDMMAGIIGSLNSPAAGIVGSIGAVIRDIASLVEEVAKKNAA